MYGSCGYVYTHTHAHMRVRVCAETNGSRAIKTGLLLIFIGFLWMNTYTHAHTHTHMCVCVETHERGVIKRRHLLIHIGFLCMNIYVIKNIKNTLFLHKETPLAHPYRVRVCVCVCVCLDVCMSRRHLLIHIGFLWINTYVIRNMKNTWLREHMQMKNMICGHQFFCYKNLLS